MDKQSNDETPRKPRSIILMAGIWITVVTAAIWVGGALIEKIKGYLPYCLGVGILVLALGLFLEYRKKQAVTAE